METATATDDVIALLRVQHELIKQRLQRVADSHGADRELAFNELCDLMEMHERAEQLVVHPVTRGATATGAAVAADLSDEEQAADGEIAQLRQLDPNSPDFDRLFAVLRADVLAHATHEEEVEFPMLRSMLTDEGLREMATEMASVQSGQGWTITHHH